MSLPTTARRPPSSTWNVLWYSASPSFNQIGMRSRDVVDHHVDVLVKNRAQRVFAVSVGHRDDIHVVAREEVAA